MKNQRKLMIAAGILTLFLIHLIAAFSLGIYIGRHGFSRQGLSLQGPQAAQQPPRPGGVPAGQPDAQPPQDQRSPRLPGEPTIVGRIRRIGRDELDLATQEGPRLIILDSETRVWNEEGDRVEIEKLTEEQIVAIFGVFGDGGQQLHADLIVILPPPEERPDQPVPQKAP